MNKFVKYKRMVCLMSVFLCIHWFSVAEKENLALNDRLDQIIGNKKTLTSQKQEKIEKLSVQLNVPHLTPEQEYEINEKIYEEYKAFQLDSAIHYIERNVTLAGLFNDRTLTNRSLLKLVTLYSYAGMYLESKDILTDIDPATLDRDLLADYYEGYYKFYSHYFIASNLREYLIKRQQYHDLLLSVLDPVTYRYKINLAEKMINIGKADESEPILLELLETEAVYSPRYAMITYLLGFVHRMKGDTEKEIEYFTLSAIADGINCLKDNASFQRLAVLYYERGDIDRAFRYTKSAIEDAIFCNIQFRTTQLSKSFTIINASYQEKEQQAKTRLMGYLLLISLLSLFLILSVVYVYRQMKKVSRIRKELSVANDRLTVLNNEIVEANKMLNEKNRELSEANTIKEQYIGNFFDLCSTYIDKLENYRRTLYKIASNKQYELLFKTLKSNTLIDKEVEDLYKNFDSIFLNLYPEFVNEFNALLEKDEQIIPKGKDVLNKELRIYALLRMGISDSTQMATFLRCSLSTIYNYRTKMRNKAIVPREQFESIVMTIG